MKKLLIIPLLLISLLSTAQDVLSFYGVGGGGAGSNGLAAINVFYAKMDEASGSIVDSKNANNGTVTPTLTYSSAGKLNTSIAQSSGGFGDFGSPAALNLTHTGSISVWVNCGSVTGAPGIVNKCNFGTDRDGYAISLQSSHPYFEICNGSTFNSLVLTSVTMTTSTWYHLVFTWDGSTIKGYVNGTLNGTTTTQTIDATNTGIIHMTLFSAYNGSTYASTYFTGTEDEVSIFNAALTGTQVTTLYNSGTPLPFASFN